MFFPLAMLSQYVFGPTLFLLSLFIVLIILLQRGRGGGLTGALGGAGGASAFGVKAGDIFTRITAISVLLWIVLCALTCFWYLPDKLNIASDPTTSSLGTTGMGAAEPEGSGAIESSTTPVETKPANVPGTENAAPGLGSTESTLPSGTNAPPALAIPPASSLPPSTSPASTEPPVLPAAAELPPAAFPESPTTGTPTLPERPAATEPPTSPDPKP